MFPFKSREMNLEESRKLELHFEASQHSCNGNFFEAIKASTSIIQDIDPRDVTSLCNRADAYYELGLFKLALEDANSVLIINPANQTAVNLRIKSLIGLGLHQEAKEFFTSKLTPEELRDPFNQHELQSLENYIAQSKGNYNVLELMDILQNESLCNIGEYYGPIKVVNIPGKGQGVIATEDIAPGQVISVTKAFAMVFGSSNPPLENEKLVKKVFQKLLLSDKETREKFRNLFTFHEERPKALRMFDWTALFELQHIRSLRWEIQTRINANRFMNNDISPRGAGIWISEVSYLNNDCIDGNVSKMFFGDKIMLRAFKEIKTGDELTIPYTNPEKRLSRKRLFKRHNFECKCRLCEFEELESPESKCEIDECLELVKSQLPTIKQQALPKAILEYFRRICELRSNHPDLNMAMVTETILTLGKRLFETGHVKECIEVFQAVRKAVYNPSGITKGLFVMDKNLIKAYLTLEDRSEVIEAVKTYKEDLVLAYGTTKVVERFGQDILTALKDSRMRLNFYEVNDIESQYDRTQSTSKKSRVKRRPGTQLAHVSTFYDHLRTFSRMI